jgi:K+-transporting ATPase KdpF subunit
VTGSGLPADIIGAVLALGLIVYLFVTLIKPEKF